MTQAGRIGRYRLDGVIGAGAFATAHRAVDERLDDVVVVKVLAENHSLNPEIRERFIAEGRALRRVRSPHVVAVHDIGETDRQQPYLVLDHADRGALAQRVEELRGRGWQATAEDLLAVARPLAAAVEAVHAARLVHRDLSPGNVLLRTVPAPARVGAPTAAPAPAVVAGDEELLLADLGMCKDLARSSGVTVAGGTDGFRPPEQRRPGSVDGRADLWALSALLGWLAEGSPVARALEPALQRSLADRPSDRHPDVRSWLADVEAALVQAPARHPSPATDPGAPRSPRRWGRVLAAGVAAAAILLLGLGIGRALDRDQPRSRSGGFALAIDGPTAVEVGDDVVLEADAQGLSSWVWTLPGGDHVVDDPAVTITARSPGRATVALRARAPDGTDLEVVHRITVAG